MTAAGKKPRILCIDDMAENLKIRTMMLEQFGCETFSAEDYESAMQVVREQHPDLLLIDYHLAFGENGERIARDVRQSDADIPLVMLSGDPNLPKSAYDCVDAVIIKGTSDPKDLLETIDRLLPRGGLRPRREMLFTEPNSKAS